MSELLDPPKKKRTLLGVLRTYFLTGLVVTAPIWITFYLALWFVEFLDGYFRPWVPEVYWPTTYLPFDIPGVGVVLALVLLTVIGGLTANFLGVPSARPGRPADPANPDGRHGLYGAAADFPDGGARRRGVILAGRAHRISAQRAERHRFRHQSAADRRVNAPTGKPMVGVFLPTTPNPTSGFLLFVPEDELTILDMTGRRGGAPRDLRRPRLMKIRMIRAG